MLLEQQELMEHPPARTLRVPLGRDSWWGIDPSTKRLAAGWITRDGLRDGFEATFPSMLGNTRLPVIYRQTYHTLLGEVAVGAPQPGCVFVEQPGGSQRNFPLYYAVGAILAAIGAAFPEVHVELVVPQAWKKVALGDGGVRKPKPHERHQYRVLEWACMHGYMGSSWDEADAWGIAECARRTVAFDVRP